MKTTLSVERFSEAVQLFTKNIVAADADNDSIVTEAELDAYLADEFHINDWAENEIPATKAFFALMRQEQKSSTVSIGVTSRGETRLASSANALVQMVTGLGGFDGKIDNEEALILSETHRSFLDLTAAVGFRPAYALSFSQLATANGSFGQMIQMADKDGDGITTFDDLTKFASEFSYSNSVADNEALVQGMYAFWSALDGNVETTYKKVEAELLAADTNKDGMVDGSEKYALSAGAFQLYDAAARLARYWGPFNP